MKTYAIVLLVILGLAALAFAAGFLSPPAPAGGMSSIYSPIISTNKGLLVATTLSGNKMYYANTCAHCDKDTLEFLPYKPGGSVLGGLLFNFYKREDGSGFLLWSGFPLVANLNTGVVSILRTPRTNLYQPVVLNSEAQGKNQGTLSLTLDDATAASFNLKKSPPVILTADENKKFILAMAKFPNYATFEFVPFG